MISGLIGHGLNCYTSPTNILASIGDKYGYSQKLLVVPLVAAFLLDVFTMPCIIIYKYIRLIYLFFRCRQLK